MPLIWGKGGTRRSILTIMPDKGFLRMKGIIMSIPSIASSIEDRADETLVLALPKGRILKAIRPILKEAGIEPEPDFLMNVTAVSASPPKSIMLRSSVSQF